MTGVKQPFFVVGLGRTGSTYLYHLLGAHPRIALTNEGRVADFLLFCSRYGVVPQKEEQKFILHREITLHGIVANDCSEVLARVFQRHALQMLEEFYEEQFADKEFTHWGDKLPWPSTAVELQTAYPHARYIILIRDPRAIAASLLSYSTRQHLPAAALLQEQSPEQWGSYWNNSYRELAKYLKHHLVVRYEDMVADPLRETTRMLDFLSLDGAEELVELASTRETFKGHATSASPEESLRRWQKALTAEQIETIEKLCAEQMRVHGYELTSA